jgi:threonine dehydrogenase-like Zn-dependent dehydrogenase/glycosyltransferase involved in cell wall biosynthesis
VGDPAPEVSVIIRTYNEERRLPLLFDGLAEQTHRAFETVVVDSGSFDRTIEIATDRADHLVQIKSADFTFGHSLNEGIRQASGRFVAIVSAHTVPLTPAWLEALIAPLRDEQVAMVYGLQRGSDPESKFGELMDFVRTFGTESLVLRPPFFFANNANAAVQRRLWERQPFDETLPGLEDSAWAKHWMSQGYRVVYEPAAGICHVHEETWPQVRRRYYREGQAARWIGLRRRRDLPKDTIREVCALGEDLWAATHRGVLLERAPEILRFRYEKTVGTIAGVWSGALMENPTTRHEVLFGTSHRAVVIHGAGRASIDDVPTPSLRPSEVLVRVAYVGVCVTDLEILDGELGYYKKGEASYPIVPGHEFSGTVAGIGARVTHLKPGDRVVVECIQGCGDCAACRGGNSIACVERREVGVIGRDGAYQEYMMTPARFAHRLPDTLSSLSACLCEPTAVVLKGLRRLQGVLVDERPSAVAVVGGGPIGHLAARILQARGHCVTLFERCDTRRECLHGSGVAVEAEFSSLSPFDVVIEATGDADVLETILDRTTPGSTLLLLGLPYGRRSFSFESIVCYDKVVVGSVGSTSADFDEAIALLPQIETGSFAKKVLPLEDYRKAWTLARTGAHLKVVLQADPSAC